MLRDVVTTIVHNHMNAATPMDVDTHIMSTEKEKSYGGSEEYKEKPEEDHEGDQHVSKTRKADPYATWERAQKEDGRPQTSRRVKDKFDECYNWSTVTEAETAGVKGAQGEG